MENQIATIQNLINTTESTIANSQVYLATLQSVLETLQNGYNSDESRIALAIQEANAVAEQKISEFKANVVATLA